MITRKGFLQGSLSVAGSVLLGAPWVGCATGDQTPEGPGADAGGVGPTDGGPSGDSSSPPLDGARDGELTDAAMTDARDSGAGVCTTNIQATIDASLPLTVANHGHDGPIVTLSDIRLGAERVYELAPGVHGSILHQAVVTQAHFAALQRGETVRIQTTSREGHSHTVVLTCA